MFLEDVLCSVVAVLINDSDLTGSRSAAAAAASHLLLFRINEQHLLIMTV